MLRSICPSVCPPVCLSVCLSHALGCCIIDGPRELPSEREYNFATRYLAHTYDVITNLQLAYTNTMLSVVDLCIFFVS